MYETELKRALKTELIDIELALNQSSIVAITDNKGFIQYTNDKFCTVSKYSREELIGSNQNIVNSGYHSRTFFKDMWRTIGTGNLWKGEMKNKAKDGSYYWVDTTIVPFLKKNGKPYQYISVRHDITQLKEYEETIKKMAYIDPLTLLPNRNALGDWLKGIEVNNIISVIFVDLDRFKSINDTYGHRMGDKVLTEVAKRLFSCLDSADLIIRQGGDEFVIFLKESENKTDVMRVIDAILKQFTFPFDHTKEPIYITASLGVTTSKIEQNNGGYLDTIEKKIRQADTAMYRAKKLGGNTYFYNTHDQNDEIERYYLVKNELKKAFRKDLFQLNYQPFFNLKRNEIVGVEALLRWDNPILGSVSPEEFIPLLEQLGLIIELGKRVLRNVCKQLKCWHNQGVLIGKAAVNVSPIQFRDKDFVTDVEEILNETGLQASLLELEVTESTILYKGKSWENLKQLRNLGVRISIDDFGTGYSSLSYLNQLPINTLKIDRSFIKNLELENGVIINTIITMGKNLDFNIIAEGIENNEQLAYLKAQGCHEGQGFYWSRAVDPREITEIYLKGPR